MQSTQVSLLLSHVQSLHPKAFQRNYVFYGQIKTKGVLDDRKEFIPWILALMIFVPISLVLKDYFLAVLDTEDVFKAQTSAVIAILLFLMLVVPLIIKQMKHSSHSLYQQLKHSPIKLTVVIVLEALNLAFLQSSFVLWLLLFFGVSFGFVRFYKENLFRNESKESDLYQLQQLRRACFWAYKQTYCLRFQLCFQSKTSPQYSLKKKQLKHYANLHTQLFKAEHEYCKKIKHIDLDSYLDELT